jgi:hypothetical protein
MPTTRDVFRFDADLHEYVDVATGAVLPHITGMLEATGWVDTTWYTEEACRRGTEVHRLTARFDLGALDVMTCESDYKSWLLAHVKATHIIAPHWQSVEVPRVHPILHFGGRPDRVGYLYNLQCVCEIKSGPPEKSHPIQTALQAILVAPDLGIPATAVQRFALYLKSSGKFALEQHKNPRDYDEARKVIKACCS